MGSNKMDDNTTSSPALLTHMPVPSRRTLLLAAGAGLLAGLGRAATSETETETETVAEAAPAATASPLGGVVLGPIALAILHHARGDRNWSSRAKIRAHLKAGGPGSLFGVEAMDATMAGSWPPEQQGITEAWQALLAATDPFQRARAFDRLVGMVDAYAAKVLNAERYFLPLSGQGFVSYDYLDQELLNDSGLVENNFRYATQRFATFERGITGAVQIVNLHVKQLTSALKGATELYRIPVRDTVLAERLLRDKASTCQMVEIAFAPGGKCSPRAEALKGVSRPMAVVGLEFLVVDAAGNKLLVQPLEGARRTGKGCGK
ncbi:MAG TPA: hypothetical protein VGE47_15275 [Burkholderiaceae bacterium]